MNQTTKLVFIGAAILFVCLLLMLLLRQMGVPIGFPIYQNLEVRYTGYELCESSTSTEKILVGIACFEDACDYEYFGQDGARRGSSSGDGSFTNEIANNAKYVKTCHKTTPEYFYRYVGR